MECGEYVDVECILFELLVEVFVDVDLFCVYVCFMLMILYVDKVV